MTPITVLAARIQPRPTENALEVLRARYLRKDDRGQIVELPAEMSDEGAGVIRVCRLFQRA